jgi:hypothetical protein
MLPAYTHTNATTHEPTLLIHVVFFLPHICDALAVNSFTVATVYFEDD